MQQINLYQPMFRKERKLFSALALLQISLACLLLMVLIGVYFQVQLHRLQASEQSLAAQHRYLESTLDALKQTAGDPALVALDARIAGLESNLQGRESLLAGMARLAGDRGGFAPLLAALGRQRIQGLWLTGIHMGTNGQGMQLNGAALEADLIPRYLEHLPADPRLQGLDFNEVQINRQSGGAGGLTFSLQASGAASTGTVR
jgi:Tfp pilus assembly protein PilN